MYFRFGSYIHPPGEVNLTTNRESIYDDAQRPIGYLERWMIQGQLQASTPGQIAVLQRALDIGYSQRAASAGLYFDNGAATPHFLNANTTYGGIRVVSPPGFPDGTRIQFVNARDYIITLEAEIYSNQSRNIISYTESVEFLGDAGPRLVMIETRNSQPQIQQVSQATGMIVVQTGSAMGRFYYPPRQTPLFPPYVNGPDTRRGKTAPTLRYDRYTNYGVSWSYTMLLPVPVDGQPFFYPRNL